MALTDGDEKSSLERKILARNQEIFQSRLDRVDQVIKPWLKMVGDENGLHLPVDLDLDIPSTTCSTEMKEAGLLRTVEDLLSIALPEENSSAPVDTIGPPAQDSSSKCQSPKEHLVYSQVPLNDQQQIRLLDLLPSGDKGYEMKVTMSCVALDQWNENLEYEALSYTWGTDKETHTINLNGHPFEVSTNLYNALVSLRLPANGGARSLWIDALCINQDDDREKTQQVALMGDIYRRASRVVVFLGMPTDKSYPLFDFLERGQRVEDVTQENMEEIVNECRVDKVRLVASFVEFCGRSWWSRVWVMQEYYLASKPPIWYIGSRGVDGAKLIRDIRGLGIVALNLALPFGPNSNGGELPEGKFGKDRTMGSLMDRIYPVVDGLLVRQVTHPYRTPRLFLAMQGGRRKATNAKDYVYGVRELLEPHFRGVFFPDYQRLSEERLFEKLAAWLLLVDGWGEMFWYFPSRMRGEVNREEEGKDGPLPRRMPSWAPDFSQRPQHLVNETEPPKFSQDDDLKIVECSIVDRVLYINGSLLDVIEEVIVMPGEGSSSFPVLQRMWQLDRVFGSNQRSDTATLYPDTDRESRALLAWATTIRPATIPLASSKTRHIGDSITAECKKYVDALTAKGQEMTDEGVAKVKAMRQSPELTRWFQKACAEMSTIHGRLVRGVGAVHRFLSSEMECDFASACVFDFDNLDSQLESMLGYSDDVQRGLDSLLSRHGVREVVYEDLIRNVWTNSYPDQPSSFRELVGLVRAVAKNIHNQLLGTGSEVSNCLGPNAAANISVAELKDGITRMKTNIKKLEEGDKTTCGSFGKDDVGLRQKEEHIDTLKKQVEEGEALVRWRIENEAHHNRFRGANDVPWSRIDEERADQFRGRQIFVTKAGLVGIACPGVEGVKVGDRVVLLDGLSFPLLARASTETDSRLTMVGCAHIRGVKPHQRVEDVELKASVRPGPKHMLAFV